MPVAGNDEVCACGDRALQNSVVGRIIGNNAQLFFRDQ